MKFIKVIAFSIALFFAARGIAITFDSPGMFDTFIQALQNISTSILPTPDNTHDLGSEEYSFNDAYINNLYATAGGVTFGDETPDREGEFGYYSNSLAFYDDTALRPLYHASGTDVAIEDGGTGASDATAMRAAFEIDMPSKGFVINSAVASDDFLLGWKAPATMTITEIHGVIATGELVGMLYICDSTNDINNPMDIPTDCDACDGTDITFDGGEDSDVSLDGTVTAGAGDWLGWVTTSVDNPGYLSVTFYYTID
jgi:hypothetical protein